MPRPLTILACMASAALTLPAQAAIQTIAIGSFGPATSDLSGLNYALEDGASASLLGGFGSAIAYAGGNTFIATPDRGPNASSYNASIDNTTSYISRFQTFDLGLANSYTLAPGAIATLAPTLTATTLLYSPSPLSYGSATSPGSSSGAPSLNTAGKDYFSGRSDNFAAGLASTDASNGRFDPEGARVSKDGKSVFITDEYGPFVYQFDRATGARIKTFTLPSHYAVATQSPMGTTEKNTAVNPVGRVANKGMEGLAITPDGSKLVGIMQNPLLQDGGESGLNTRIVVIDIATGSTKEYAYKLDKNSYGISEILAVNDHQFLVDERDGGNNKFKKIFSIDLNEPGLSDVSGVATLGAVTTPTKTVFLDLLAKNADGTSKYGLWTGTDPVAGGLPSKIEGMAFGKDVMVNGVLKHTLVITNDNDFVTGAGAVNNNYFYVFGIDGDAVHLNGDGGLALNYSAQEIAAPVPLPAAWALMAFGMGGFGVVSRRRKAR
ncbi:esterase-like activity of phytase family protein [Methylibium sp.]|uniref:esterase-like activity of phytase family protein n=1 Tax=Methylibium sp. TaxID=2067992 RepID=UPI003D0C037B